MSTPSPLYLSGSYTRESLGALLRGIQQQQQSGILQVTTDERVGNIHFIQGKLAATDFAGLSGAAAFQRIATTPSGRYEFKAGFVQFSQIGMEKRIHQSLESLLSTDAVIAVQPPPVVAVEFKEPPPSVSPEPAFNLEAFDLEALDLDNSPDHDSDLGSSAAKMPSGFMEALLAEFVRGVGPAGYVLIEEIALDLRIDSRAMTSAQAARLIATMLGQIPVSKQSAFQFSCSGLLKQFKP